MKIALTYSVNKANIALMAIWTPDLSGRRGPMYLRIVDALADDIAGGALQPGARLPPHRELAYRIGVSPNTTNRAYKEAVNRALVRGEVGRGSFVRGPSSQPPIGEHTGLVRNDTGPIDLSRNLPLPGIAGAKLAETCSALGRSDALRPLVDYQTETDLDHHGDAAIEWLRRHGVRSSHDEAVVTAGAQHGIFATLMALAQPGDLLLVEALTYAPVKPMAARLGLKLMPVPMDADGICPDDLDRLCRDRSVRALYLNPTLQTPTGGTLRTDRRKALAATARRHDILVIEDNVFGLLHPEPPRPLAAFAPERAIHVTSTSKYLAPGLRVGFIHAPAPLAKRIRGAVNLSCWMMPPLMAEIAARWIADGTADQLTGMQLEAAVKRQRLARRMLGEHLPKGETFGFHLWLELPPGWPADLFCGQAAARGVKVTNGSAFAVDPGDAPNAVRICLSHEADEHRVERGLGILREILDEGPGQPQLIL